MEVRLAAGESRLEENGMINRIWTCGRKLMASLLFVALASSARADVTVTFIGNHSPLSDAWYRASDDAIAVCSLSCQKPGSSCTISQSVTETVKYSVQVGASSGIDWAGVKEEIKVTFGVEIGKSVTTSVSTTIAPPDCHKGTLWAFPAYQCKLYKVVDEPWLFGDTKTATIHVLTPVGGIAKVWKNMDYRPECSGCCPEEGLVCEPPAMDAWHCGSDDLAQPLLADFCDTACGDETTATCQPFDPQPLVSSNDTPLNNGGDAVFFYSSPSSGASSLATTPDVSGDLYWRSHSGAAMMNDVDPDLGSVMEVSGYFEWLLDTNWSTSPSFYVRAHGPALQSLAGNGNLEPAFFQNGIGPETVVAIGPSGFGNPCTVQPTLCSPLGGGCAPPGLINGYQVDLAFDSTPGSGIVLPADGTASSDMATTYFVTGGMTATGGPCGGGDYALQDVHSTDESQADLGFGINPNGGFQIAGGGPVAEGVNSMTVATEAWRGNVVNVVADSGGGLGVEVSANGGGGTNGRNLTVGSGVATIGVELRDLRMAQTLPGLNLGIVGASFSAIPNPGLAALGGNLLVFPDALFSSTSGAWQAPISTGFFSFTTEGWMSGAQLQVPPSGAGATLHIQGASLSLLTISLDSTNAVSTRFHP